MYNLELLPRNNRETSRQYALRILRHNILFLTLPPGQLISESELGEQLCMSRTPIREALKDLEKSHIVQIEPQKGTFVSEIDSYRVSNACFLRLNIERAVISLACKGISQEYINRLEETVFLSSYYVSKGDIEKWFLQDEIFHGLIYEACGKEEIYQLLDDIMLHFNRLRIKNLTVEGITLAQEEHTALLDAIKKCDEKTALEKLEQHLTYCIKHCN